MTHNIHSRLLQQSRTSSVANVNDGASDSASGNIVIDTATVRQESAEFEANKASSQTTAERPSSRMSEQSAASTSKTKDDLAMEDIEEATVEENTVDTLDNEGFEPIKTSSNKDVDQDVDGLIVSSTSDRAVAVAASISQLVLQVNHHTVL